MFQNKRIKDLIIFPPLIIIVLVSLQTFLGSPLSRYASRLKEEFNDRQSRLNASNKLIKGLPDPQKAIEDIQRRLEEFKEMEIEKKQQPRLIQSLAQSVQGHNINIISLRPREDIKTNNEDLPPGVSKVYIEMVCTGSFQGIGEYLKALSELPAFFSIEAISIEKIERLPQPLEAGKTIKEPKQVDELLCTLLLGAYLILEI